MATIFLCNVEKKEAFHFHLAFVKKCYSLTFSAFVLFRRSIGEIRIV